MTSDRNPLDSEPRRQLLQYIPATAKRNTDGTYNLAGTFINSLTDAVKANNLGPGTPEADFLANFNTPDDQYVSKFQERIESYCKIVAARLKTSDGALDYMRLAESHRRTFRKTPLSEFNLTFAYAAAIPEEAPPVRMREDGTIEEMTGPVLDAHRARRTAQIHKWANMSGGCVYDIKRSAK